MTLHTQTDFTIPEETMRVARAAYPHGNALMKMRDALGTIYQDQAFASLFPHNGRVVEAPWRLALITVLQFMEELPDRQAADAVRGRIDWKYLLGLELADPGFDASVLCEFRQRLVQGGAEHLLLDALLVLCQERGWLKTRERQRTDSTHVLAKIRAINRFMCVGEAMRFALNSLAVVVPEWLLAHSDAEWVERYGIVSRRVACPNQREIASLWPNWLEGTDGKSSLRCLIRWLPPGCEKSLRFRSYVRSGSKTTSLRTSNSAGEKPEIFPLLRCSSARLMIPKPTEAKSARPCGRDTRSISPKPVNKRFLI